MPLDQIDVDKIGDNSEKEMSFLDHLEELRWHLIRSFVSIFAFGIILFIMHGYIFDHIILAHLKKDFFTYQFACNLSESLCFYPSDVEIKTIKLEEQFITSIKVSFLLGFVLSFPYIIYEIWRFIKPGLYDKEKKVARGMVFISSMLFFTGVLFGYFVVAPFAVTFLSNYSVADLVSSEVSLNDYISLLTMIILPAGFVFELPLAVYFLSKLGLVTPEGMKKYRRHAFIVILILAAIITPPDITTQFLIGVPLFVLYELSIAISARVIKNQQKADANK